MNRQTVRYSVLGSVALVLVLGIVYFLFLGGTQAGDGAAGQSPRASRSATASANDAAQSPDPLFSEPVQLWKQGERPSSNDPFGARSSPVKLTSYGDEPGRLPSNADANPLRSSYGLPLDPDALPSARRTGGESMAGETTGAVQPSGDPFGLRTTAHNGADQNQLSSVKSAPRSMSAQAGSAYAGPYSAAATPPANRDLTDRFDEDDADAHHPHEPPDDLAADTAPQPLRHDFGQMEPPVNSGGTLQASPGTPRGNAFSGGVYDAPDVQSPPHGRTTPTLAAIGSGRPGSRQVEGKQVPQVTIEKTAPQEVQVDKPARFQLHIRNTGTVVAQGVEVRDLVPEGAAFLSANPPATPGPQGELVWTLGALKPGDETTIEVELAPLTEGEIGSVAVVVFHAEAGARSVVTRPDLTLQVTAAKQVMIGHDVLLSIKIGNPGTGPATGVVLEERVPPGLRHAAGGELEFEVGTLKPGETRDLELTLTAAQAGRIINQVSARGEGNLQAVAHCELEVIAPALQITMDGPSRRYLERQATYTVAVSNPGTAPAKDVELVARLPRGLKFVKANNAGHYDAQTHTVAWSLEELPPAETGTVMLTAIPVEPGEQRLRAEGRAKQNLADEKEQLTVVEGLAALLFEVVDVADPIEVNGETEYEIRITNQGSKAADNVRLVALLPPELKFVSAEGPTRHAVDGQRVLFEPLARLSPKADTTYRVAVQGVQPGDVRMRVQLMTDDLQHPVTKEESTRVYSDE